jgi:hypothetical protein
MTVGELIAILAELDDDQEVLIKISEFHYSAYMISEVTPTESSGVIIEA